MRPYSTVLILSSIFFVSNSLSNTVMAQQRAPSPKEPQAAQQTVDPETAQRRLVEGNRRFVQNRPMHPHASAQRRVTIGLSGQHPFAIVLSCADSRVPPENVFDAGLGDLFVVRVAGHIVDDAVIGSIEYASQHLGARLLVVLGHEKCGAVQAAIDNLREAHLRYLVEAIQPAVAKVRNEVPAADQRGLADRAIAANVFEAMSELESSEPVLRQLVARKQLKIMGAVYDLETGKVEFVR